MEPFTGFLMFHWTLGILGVYFLLASLTVSEDKTSKTFRAYQFGFFIVIVMFMASGLYFYNFPIAS